MFGAFTFGSPYFGDSIVITHGAAEPHVISAFARYQPYWDAFGRYSDALDALGVFDAELDAFANEEEV